MKKAVCILSFMMLCIIVFGQSPQAFKYQAIIRDVSGNVLANQNVGIQISILEGSDTGTPVYIETWNLTSNQFGLITLNVGEGTSSDDFTLIDWGNNAYYLKTALDETGGINYSDMGASQLLSVPYALYSNTAANGTSQWLNNGSDIYYSSGNVGIGTNSPANLLDVNGTISANGGTSDLWNIAYGWGNHADEGYLTSDVWSQNGNSIFYNSGNVGIGTGTPTNKLVIKAENDTDTLLELQDMYGNPIMVITPQLTKFNFIEGAKGVSGGFAVGRYATAKGGKAYSDTALLVVTPDSTRVYTSGSTVTSGGFAVGRYATAKGNKSYVKKYFYTGIDSTRIYTDGNGAKGVSGGFAVGRYATAKGTKKYNFFTDIDSTRINTGGSAKGVSGGFAVGRYATAKGSSENYMYMVPENYFIGHDAGVSLQNSAYTGKYNLFCGFESGLSDTSGSNNAFFGYRTGYNNTIGNANTFLGDSSGFGNTTGNGNLFVGKNSGISNTTGNYNSFIGYESGASNTEGANNTFLGSFSGYSNIIGNNNSFVGQSAGYSNINGWGNSFVGINTGYNNTSGIRNIFIGFRTGFYNTDGNDNVFMGYETGFNNIGGDNNVFMGYNTGYSNTNGINNVFLGNQSGYSNTLGQSNVYIGYNAGYTNTSGKSNVYIGENAGYTSNGDYNIFIGNESGKENITGSTNVFLGDSTGTMNTVGTSNVFLGFKAGCSNNSGDDNVYIGNNAGYTNQGGGRSVYIGHNAGYNANGDWANVFIGWECGYSTTVAYNNVAVGTLSGRNLTWGESNVFIGTSAGKSNTTGSYNVFLGQGAGEKIVNGSDNILIGFGTGYDNLAGQTNIMIGNQAGFNNTGSSNIFIGNQAGYYETGSDRLYIDNSTTTAPLIYGQFDNDALKVNGNLVVEKNTTGNTIDGYNTTSVGGTGVFGRVNTNSPTGSGTRYGVRGYGWYGQSSNYGLYGYGYGGTTAYGVYGFAAGGTTNWAGYFAGNVRVTGTFNNSKSGIIIDHPLNPENKFLTHSSVESPDMMNIYNGNVILDSDGKAVVILPDYFEALNMEFRYQLTAIGSSGPNLFIADEISNNKFQIAGGKPGMKVSWQVTGIRKDPYAKANKIDVELDKNQSQKGKYLHPNVYNLPSERGIDYNKENKE